MALAITEPTVEVASTSNVTSYAMGAFTPAANSLLVCMVFATGTVAAGTMSGGGLTWTRRTSINYNTNDTAYLFTAPVGASPVSTTPTFDCTGDAATGAVMMIWQVTGTSVTVVQVDAEARTGANPTITMPSALDTNNAYMAGFGMPRNPPTSTAPNANWTEIADTGYNTPASGASGAHRVNGETGSTITFTSASAAYGILAIEVREAGLQQQTLSDTSETTTDSIAETATFNRTLSDTASVTDSLTGATAYARTNSDTSEVVTDSLIAGLVDVPQTLFGANLKHWWKEQYASGTWTDEQGNANATQGTAGLRPTTITKNGKTVLEFDGTDDVLDAGDITALDSSFTVFGVFRADASGPTQQNLLGKSEFVVHTYDGTLGENKLIVDEPGGTDWAASNGDVRTATRAAWHVFVFTYDASGGLSACVGTLYLNSATAATDTITGGDPLGNTADAFLIGDTSGASGGQLWNGAIGNVGIVDRVATAGEIASLVQYLQEWIGHAATLSDAIATTDAIAAGLVYQATLSDTVSITDALASGFEATRTFADTLTITDGGAFNPATLSLTGWWRSYGGSSPWNGTASGGTSGSNSISEATNPPGAGANLNGYGTADFDGTNDKLDSTFTLDDLINAGAWSAWVLFYADTLPSDPGAGSRWSVANFVVSNPNAYLYIGATTGGVHVSGNAGTNEVQVAGDPTGGWHLAQARWNGTTLSLRVDGGTRQTGSSTNTGGLTETMRFGVKYNATSFFDGRIADMGFIDSALSDADEDNVYNYVQARYFNAATAGGVVTTLTIARSASDAVSVTDALGVVVTYARTSTDGAEVVTDSIAETATFARAATDGSEAVTDTLSRAAAFASSLSDTATIAETLTQTASYSATGSDTATTTDGSTQTVTFARSAADAESVTDDLTYEKTGGLVYSQTLSDSVDVTDATTPAVWYARTSSDVGETVTDALTRTASYGSTASDTANTTDAGTTSTVYARSAADAETTTDAIARTTTFGSVTADTVSATDALTAVAVYARTTSDTATATEALSQVAWYDRPLVDTVAISDAVDGNLAGTFSATFTESIEVTEALTTATAYARASSDAEAVTEQLAQTAAFARSSSDTSSTADALTRTATYGGNASDTVTSTDTSTYVAVYARQPSDALDAVDVAALALAYARAALDALDAADTLTATTSAALQRTESDTVATTDAATTEAVFARAVGDAESAVDVCSVAFDGARTVLDIVEPTDTVGTSVAYATTLADAVAAADALSAGLVIPSRAVLRTTIDALTTFLTRHDAKTSFDTNVDARTTFRTRIDPMKLYVGAVAKIRTTLVVDNVGTDPSSLSITVVSPLGTRTTYAYGVAAEVVREDAGKYRAEIRCTEPGTWAYKWLSPGPNAEGADEGTFLVETPVL